MPFGISSASEVLQKRTYDIFGDIENVHVIADDMLIAAADDNEHDETLRKILTRAQEYNVKFNKDKIQFKKTEVIFMGRKIAADGIRPDEAKIAAIVNMPNPEDKEGVQRLLGMLNFLSPFIPNMSSITSPLRNLIKAGTPWRWQPEHDLAVKKLKSILSSKPVLRLYDPSLRTTIQADASSTGLGACLLQESQPVAYASRALTDPETRYANIEREMLAIVFAVQQFHHYIYGHEVEIQSDHKPLQAIVQKPLHKASPRLQLMLLKLLKYQFVITYTPGSKMYIADTLSRASVKDVATSSPILNENMRVHSVTATIPATLDRLQSFREATTADQLLMKLKMYTQNGWPSHKGTTPNDLQSYWPIRDEIHEENGIIFAGDRMIVPASMREGILKQLHKSHLGMDKCKARAYESLYWPNMSRDIEQEVANCAVCATYRRKNEKQPLMPHGIPERPWAKLGADIFEFGGHDYLLVVDYYSKYPEVARLQNKTAKGVIDVMRPIFARHGIPDTLIADNMPFNSHAMREFAHNWNFAIVTSSPRYPQSNGQSEKFVGIVKSLMRKAYHDGQDPNIALLQYRNTPVSGMKFSPAQLLMSRRLKDNIPIVAHKLQPKLVPNPAEMLQNRQDQQRSNYDKHGTRQLKQHQIGDSVQVRLNKTWDKAVVTGKPNIPHSYYVMTQDGQTYRRNERFINKSPDQANIMIHNMPEQSTSPYPGMPDRQMDMEQPYVSPPAPTVNEGHSPQASRLPLPTRRSVRHRVPPKWQSEYVSK